MHEQGIGKMPKIQQANGDKSGRTSVNNRLKKCIKTMSKNMENTSKMTSGKGVEKCDEKRCPGGTQAHGDRGGGVSPTV